MKRQHLSNFCASKITGENLSFKKPRNSDCVRLKNDQIHEYWDNVTVHAQTALQPCIDLPHDWPCKGQPMSFSSAIVDGRRYPKIRNTKQGPPRMLIKTERRERRREGERA